MTTTTRQKVDSISKSTTVTIGMLITIVLASIALAKIGFMASNNAEKIKETKAGLTIHRADDTRSEEKMRDAIGKLVEVQQSQAIILSTQQTELRYIKESVQKIENTVKKIDRKQGADL